MHIFGIDIGRICCAVCARVLAPQNDLCCNRRRLNEAASVHCVKFKYEVL